MSPDRRVVIRDIYGMSGIGGVLPPGATALPQFTADDNTVYRLIAVRDRYVLYEPQQPTSHT